MDELIALQEQQQPTTSSAGNKNAPPPAKRNRAEELKEKRALDAMEGDDFMGLKKRKRALDILEGDDFIGMQRKRSSGVQRQVEEKSGTFLHFAGHLTE